MLFFETKPFVRFANKTLLLTKQSDYQYVLPCDNRLFYCTSGNGTIQTEKNVYKMQKGSLLLLPAGEKYLLNTPSEQVVYSSVNFDYTFAFSSIAYPVPPVPVEKFQENDLIEKIELSDCPKLNEILYLREMHSISQKIAELISTFQKKKLHFELELSGILLSILVECLRFSKITVPRQHNVVNDILQYIHEHYNLPLTNQEIAMRFGYNKNYISELIKISTGLPLHKYVLRIRINRAIELLENSKKNIGEIAEDCGFYDLYHFSKSFKAITGIPPSKYRTYTH